MPEEQVPEEEVAAEEIGCYLSRDVAKVGGEVKMWHSKPTQLKSGAYRGKNVGDKDDPIYEQPLFSMTEESFEETYDSEVPDFEECEGWVLEA